MSNPNAKITMFRATIVKTNTFHRITAKAPNLLRRWHFDLLMRTCICSYK